MKKTFLIMASAMACMSMVASPGADKKDALKTLGSRTDLVTQTEMLMSALSSDGFGLDAEEYELLMGQDLDMLDDLAGSITMPSCASNAPNLQRKPRDWDEPIDPFPRVSIHSAPDLSGGNGGSSGNSSFEDMIKGNVRPGGESNVAPAGGDDAPRLNSPRRPKDWEEPIDPVPRVSIHGATDLSGGNGGSEGNSSFEDLIKGNVKPGGESNVAAASDDDDAPRLNFGGRPRDWDEPIDPVPRISLHGATDFSGGSNGSSGSSSFEDMIKGNVRPNGESNVTPGGDDINGGRPTRPIGPGPIDF